jgi:hypothetical protein
MRLEPGCLTVHYHLSLPNFLTAWGKSNVCISIPPALRPAFKDQTHLWRSTGTSGTAIAKTPPPTVATGTQPSFTANRALR